jgi:hypothetical protein
MAKGKEIRGRKPPRTTGRVPEAPPPRNYDDETPKFCLHFLQAGFDVQALSTQGQAAFAKTLQKLAVSKWKDLITAPRHGQGTEFIPAAAIKAPMPLRFQDRDRFLVFRYDGLLPMAGVRVNDVYHVVWIEPEFNLLYDHE